MITAKEIAYTVPVGASTSELELLFIQFAHARLLKVKQLMKAKYHAGETGYITDEEWKQIFKELYE